MSKTTPKKAYLVRVTQTGQADEVYVAVSRSAQHAIDAVAERGAGYQTVLLAGTLARDLVRRLKLKAGDVKPI